MPDHYLVDYVLHAGYFRALGKRVGRIERAAQLDQEVLRGFSMVLLSIMKTRQLKLELIAPITVKP